MRDTGTSRWFPSGFLQTEEIASVDAKGKLCDVQLRMRPDHPAAGSAAMWESHGIGSHPSLTLPLQDRLSLLPDPQETPSPGPLVQITAFIHI